MMHSEPAPGMAEAMAILRARVNSMSGAMTVEEYTHILAGYLNEVDTLILASALASVSAAFANIAAAHADMPVDDLLQRVALAVAQS